MISKMMMHKIFCVLIVLTGMTSLVARASCTLTTPAATVNLPDVILTPSDKGTIGTVLYSTSIQVPAAIGYSCAGSGNSTWRSSYTRSEFTKTTIPNIYRTNIAGIGIRIKWPASRADNSWVPGSFSCLGGTCSEASDKLTLEFVQIAIAASGTIPAGSIVTVDVSSDSEPLNTLRLLTVNMGQVTVNVRSCSIYASSNSIDLGEYSLADIKTSGFTADKKDFTITLECPVSTSAKITFEGREPWGMSTGIIENMGDAKNVYVKLSQKSGSRYLAKELNTTSSFGSSAPFTGTRKVTYAGEMHFEDTTRANATAGNVYANVIYTLTLN